MKRDFRLDLLRIAATLAVIMIHCSGVFVSDAQASSSGLIAGTVFNGISRFGVPVFVMITGSLLLNEDKLITLRDVFCKYIKGILTVLVFWSVVYALIYSVARPLLSGGEISLFAVASAIIRGHYHLWYLYMLIGLYLALPFFKSFTKKENKGLVLFFIAIALVSSFISPLGSILTDLWPEFSTVGYFLQSLHLQFFGGFAAYFLTGWYITHIGISKKWLRIVIYLSGVCSAAIMIFYVLLTKDVERGYANLGIPIFFFASGIFLWFSNMRELRGEGFKKLLASVSTACFGVYVVHPLVLAFVERVISFDPPALYIPFFWLAVAVISFAGSLVVTKIPILKKTIKA